MVYVGTFSYITTWQPSSDVQHGSIDVRQCAVA